MSTPDYSADQKTAQKSILELFFGKYASKIDVFGNNNLKITTTPSTPGGSKIVKIEGDIISKIDS